MGKSPRNLYNRNYNENERGPNTILHFQISKVGRWSPDVPEGTLCELTKETLSQEHDAIISLQIKSVYKDNFIL